MRGFVAIRALIASAAWIVSLAALAFAEDTVDLAREVREAKVREAALRSVSGSLAVLKEELETPEQLTKRMLAESGKFVEPESARTQLAEAERSELRNAFRRQLEVFARGRDEALPASWVEDVVRDEAPRIDAAIDDIVGNSFADRFAAARQAAVERQRKSVRERLLPASDALLSLAGDPAVFAAAPNGRAEEIAASDEARRLAERSVAEIRKSAPLFQEIDGTLDGAARSAIAEALVELWRQLGTVERIAPIAAIRKDDIAAALRADLQTVATASQLPYGVFPEVAARVEARAAEIERTRLAERIGQQLAPADGCLALSAKEVVAAAGDTPTAMPESFATHAAALGETLRAPTAKRIVAQHAAAVAEAERAAFTARLTELLATDESVQRRFSAAFAACLEPPLRQHREQLAIEAVTQAVPSVADLSFEIADDDLASLAASDEETDPSLFPKPEALHLEESDALFLRHIAALQREARAALRLQELLTRAPERRRRFVREVEADNARSAERKREYQKAYEAEVLSAWNERRNRVLLRSDDGRTLHPNKYARIFPTTAEIIDEIITIEFERPAPTSTRAPTPPTPIPTRPPTRIVPTPRPTPITPRPTRVPPTQPRKAALPAKATPTLPMPHTGGAPKKVGPGAGKGGPKSCEQRLHSCLRATDLCYHSLVACRDRPDACAQAVARCGQAKFECERTK